MTSPSAFDRPRCSSALSTSADSAIAWADVCRTALHDLNAPVDLALLFASHHHGPHFEEIAESVCRHLDSKNLIGCTGESIVGGNQEIEEGPALSLWLAHLPGSRVTPLHIHFERTPDGGMFVGWPHDRLPNAASSAASDQSCLLLLGEPFSFPADAFLERLAQDEPGLPVLGGMASGASEPGANRLLLGPHAITTGAVGVLLEGRVKVSSVVSQGCRPIGRPYIVTQANRNVITALAGKPPLEQFRELFRELPTSEQALVQRGLHVGLVMNEYQEEFSRGDFLVRNVIGADPETGAMAIGDYVQVGQTILFHLRDANSADEDLRELLATFCQRSKNISPAGALLFTCNGRGTRLFDQPHHDAQSVCRSLGKIPLAGFFAQGELGPVAGRNFMHGFTASIAVFE